MNTLLTPVHSPTRFSRDLLLSALFVVLLATAFAFSVWAEMRAGLASDLRTRSFLLADELRQSSDDLTRMVRTYVATGDSFYKQNYQDTLDIRNGTKPRPEDYWRVYWDLLLPGGPAPRPETQQTIALLDLMRQAGFSDQEFRKLAEAKANSDALTTSEFEAMRLVESSGPESELNRANALRMLFDDKYHRAKAGIMKPIDDFILMADRRTLAAVESARTQATALRYLFIAIGVALICLLWRTYLDMRGILGGPLARVHAEIIKIGHGDFSSTVEPKEGLENSVEGRLSAMRARLRTVDHERKEYEGKLAAIAAELEVKVASRTAELALALQAATESDRLKSEFLANLTHELRTPMNAVIGFTELLKAEVPGRLNAKQAEFVAHVLASAQHLLALFDGILQMSRVDAGGGRLKRQPVEIRAALEQFVGAHRSAAEAHRATIAVQVAENTGREELDAAVLQRILDALLDNAVKFNHDGGSVTLSARSVGGALEIAVADTGIGIAQGDLGTLFKPFAQLDAGLARRRGGIGVGLSLARRLAQLHGGTIGVESELGKGSTFTLRLPTGGTP